MPATEKAEANCQASLAISGQRGLFNLFISSCHLRDLISETSTPAPNAAQDSQLKGWQQAPQSSPLATDSRVAPAQLCLEVWAASHNPGHSLASPPDALAKLCLQCSQGNSFAFVCLAPRQPSLRSTRLCAVRACNRLLVVPSAFYKRALLTQEGPQGYPQGEKPSLNTCIRPVPV